MPRPWVHEPFLGILGHVSIFSSIRHTEAPASLVGCSSRIIIVSYCLTHFCWRISFQYIMSILINFHGICAIIKNKLYIFILSKAHDFLKNGTIRLVGVFPLFQYYRIIFPHTKNKLPLEKCTKPKLFKEWLHNEGLLVCTMPSFYGKYL